MNWIKSSVARIKAPWNPFTVPSYNDWSGNAGPRIYYVKAAIRQSYHKTQEQYRFEAPRGMHILDVLYQADVWSVEDCEVVYHNVVFSRYTGEYIVNVCGNSESVVEVRLRLKAFMSKRMAVDGC